MVQNDRASSTSMCGWLRPSIEPRKLRPSYDFMQEILWNGEDAEVLEPQWFREKIAEKINRMWNKYRAEKGE